MNREEIELIAKSRFKPRTWPSEPPPAAEWQSLEARLGCRLPTELFEIQVLSAHYHIEGDHLPADELLLTYDSERGDNPHWTEDMIPFCAIGNGDFLCIRRSEGTHSGVYYVTHDDADTQRLHLSIADYIRDPEWFS